MDFQEFSVDQPMLGGELRRGSAADTTHDPALFDQRAACARPGQIPGAKNTSQASSDDQHIRVQISLQLRKLGHLHIRLPNSVHLIITGDSMRHQGRDYYGRLKNYVSFADLSRRAGTDR